MFAAFFTILTIIAIILTMFSKWYLAKGILRPVYWLGIGIGITYLILNTVTAFLRPEFQAVIFYNLLSIYAISMSIKGLNRLRKENASSFQMPEVQTYVED